MIAFFMAMLGMAQNSDSKANAAIQEEMRLYHKELNLTGEQTYQLTQILGEKIKKSEVLEARIEELKQQLDQIDLMADKQIISVLNEDQQKIMQEKLNAKLAKQQEEFKNSLTD